jgi:hypothetical protein
MFRKRDMRVEEEAKAAESQMDKYYKVIEPKSVFDKE